VNHLHVPLLPFPYTFNAVVVIALGDMAVASVTLVVLVDAVNPLQWMLFVLAVPVVTAVVVTLMPSLPSAVGRRMLFCGLQPSCSGTRDVNLGGNEDPCEAAE
jgi:hypothetical protein